MKTLYIIGTAILLITAIGCDERLTFIDLTPPAPPQGLYTTTGDNVVGVSWVSNTEHDLAGYNVYVSEDPAGRFELIATTRQNYFADIGVRNGTTYYYAVSAFDHTGNESRLSDEIAYETPRPEGYNVVLRNFRVSPDHSGYDFSTYSVGPYNDNYTDIFYEYYNGEYYMDVWEDTDIQDMGYTNSLYTIGEAPDAGWSPTKDVRLIVGHTYVVWTWDNHYAKFRVVSLSPSQIMMDWAYQTQTGNPRLKHSVGLDRNTLKPGNGFRNRQ